MSCFCFSNCVSLDQLKNHCRDAGDCAHNYNGACAPASARKSLRIRSCCLFTICKQSDDLSFHLVHRCDQMHALTRAGQSTNAMCSSVTFASPLSTPIHRNAERGVVSPIDCHSDVSFLSRIYCGQSGSRDTCASPTIANARRNRPENGEVLKTRGGEARPDTSSKTETRSTVDVPRRSKT